MSNGYGSRLRDAVSRRDTIPFIGIYDVFSATMAARHYDALFFSGFGFAASHYGLPDIGFIAWSDMVDFVQRARTVLPDHHLLVDIDDGYCDTEVACHVATLLESVGASGIVLEDQKRPRKCGHFDGKQIMELDDFLEKLHRVLEVRTDIFVVARTDASDPDDIARRVTAFSEAGADAILVDGVKDLEVVKQLSASVPQPFTFNQIAGGKSPPCTLSDLKEHDVSLVIYSTPCLFSAQKAIDDTMRSLKGRDGLIAPAHHGGIGVKECTSVLQENHERRIEGARGAVLRKAV